MQVKNFLIILFLALSNVGMAQVRISVADIIGTKWKIKDSSDNDYMTYTSEREVWYNDDGSQTDFSYPYYLTDTPVKSPERSAFDYSKVGKGTTGCYLVVKNEKAGTTYCHRIQYFDKEEGIMEMKLITDRIIGWNFVTGFSLIK